MVKCNQQWLVAREKIHNGEIGELRMIQIMFSYYNIDPANIRNIPEVGGGAIWDINCYPVSMSRFLFGQEPVRVAASLEFDPVMKTDRPGSVIMEDSEVPSTFEDALLNTKVLKAIFTAGGTGQWIEL